MKFRYLTLKNDFHNTLIDIVVIGGMKDIPKIYYVSAVTTLRVRKTLCGIYNCICDGGLLRERGKQDEKFILKF